MFIVVFLLVVVAYAVVEELVSPSKNKETETNTLSQPSPEVLRAREERALKTEQMRANAIKQAKERNARLKNAEIEPIVRERETLLKDLRAMAKAYPASPEIAQSSYQAREQIRRIEHQYDFKIGAIRDQYEARDREVSEAIQKATEAELSTRARIMAAEREPEIPRAAVVSIPNPPLKPFLESPRPSGEGSYVVAGIARNDVLNVRSGPGTNYEVVAKLENGRTGLRIVGPAVMNGATEWVPIALEDRTGWVTKVFLKAE